MANNNNDQQQNKNEYGVQMDLLLAADCGDVELVKSFLETEDVNQKFNNPKFNHSCTALHYASRSGHYEVVKLLLDHKASIDCLDIEDWSPLYYAANSGHLEIAQLLLERGADKNIKDNFKGRTALDVAKYRQFHDMVKLLGGKVDKSYVRSQDQIDKKGSKKKVLKGVHWNFKDLFLGRYRISQESAKAIQEFREDPDQRDVTIPAEDTILGIQCFIRHFHKYEDYRDETAKFIASQKKYLRASTISTNEHIVVSREALNQ